MPTFLLAPGPLRGLMPFACLCLASLLPGGCSPPPAAPTNVISGTVTYGDTPVWQGRVTFLGPDNRVASSALTPEGRFRIVNPPLGTVRVAVTNHPTTAGIPHPPRAGPAKPGQAHSVLSPSRPLVLPARHGEPFDSGVTVEVGAGEQEVAIRLARRPGDPPEVPLSGVPSVGTEVGQVAPDISGEDLEGWPFRLSDHRGKVVALLFWGHW